MDFFSLMVALLLALAGLGIMMRMPTDVLYEFQVWTLKLVGRALCGIVGAVLVVTGALVPLVFFNAISPATGRWIVMAAVICNGLLLVMLISFGRRR